MGRYLNIPRKKKNEIPSGTISSPSHERKISFYLSRQDTDTKNYSGGTTVRLSYFKNCKDVQYVMHDDELLYLPHKKAICV